jgi:hypothetical protein
MKTLTSIIKLAEKDISLGLRKMEATRNKSGRDEIWKGRRTLVILLDELKKLNITI